MNRTWKLLAILGAVNLVTSLSVVGVGLAYDFLHITPGTISMIGVGLMSAPWIGLSRHFYTKFKTEQTRQASELNEHPRDIIKQLSSTGTHRTIQALIEEHGAAEIFGVLTAGEDTPQGRGGGLGSGGKRQ